MTFEQKLSQGSQKSLQYLRVLLTLFLNGVKTGFKEAPE